MKRVPKLVFGGAVLISFVYLVVIIPDTAARYAFELQAQESLRSTPTPRQSYGPDISHCFQPEETRELWDCIRHEED